MFHELVADGPIWTSPFWLHGIQCGLIRRFARESSVSLTSNARYRQHLAQIAGIEESRIVRMPVLSTVGEPGELPPPWARKRQLVVFGRRPSRDCAFSRCLPSLELACKNLRIERVLEVGPDAGAREHRLPVAVEATGALAPAQVSSILRESLFGFIGLDADILSKSSVFAAYCAHSIAPIVAGEDGGEADGLSPNQQYLRAPPDFGVGDDRLEAVCQAAHTWYRGHSLAAQAAQYAGIMAQLS